MPYRTAGQVVPIEVMLQKAGEAEEGQAELLQAVLYGLGGPDAGAQLGVRNMITQSLQFTFMLHSEEKNTMQEYKTY